MEQWYCRHDDDEKDWTGGHVRPSSKLKACGPIKASNNLHPQISIILVLLGLYQKTYPKKKKKDCIKKKGFIIIAFWNCKGKNG